MDPTRRIGADGQGYFGFVVLRFGVATPSIARALQRVLELEILPPSGTIRPPGPTALLNPRRLELLLTAAAYPGIHLRSAARLLLLSLDALRGHAARLEAEGVLRRDRMGRRVCLFVPGMFGPTAERLLTSWSEPTDRRVLGALRSRGPANRADLAASTHLHPHALDRVLRRLVSAGAIRLRPTGAGTVVALTPAWRRFERECRVRVHDRLDRFSALLEAQALRPEVEEVEGTRARYRVDGPRGRVRFVLPLDPLREGGP